MKSRWGWFAVAACVGGVVVNHSSLLVGSLRDPLQKELGRLLGAPVIISKVTGGLSGTVTLHGISTSPKPNMHLSIREVGLAMNVGAWVTGARDPLTLVRFVTLREPVVRWVRPVPSGLDGSNQPTSHVSVQSDGANPLTIGIPVPIRIRHGQLVVQSLTQGGPAPFVIGGISGSIIPEGAAGMRWHASVSHIQDRSARVRTDGVMIVERGSPAHAQWSTVVERAPAEMLQVMGFLGWKVGPLPAQRSGIEGSVAYRGSWPVQWNHVRGAMRIRNLAIGRIGESGVAGAPTVTVNLLSADLVDGHGQGEIMSTVIAPHGSASVQLRCDVDAGPSGFHGSGAVVVNQLKLGGTSVAPVSARVVMEGSRVDIQAFRAFKDIVGYGHIDLRARTGGGRVTVGNVPLDVNVTPSGATMKTAHREDEPILRVRSAARWGPEAEPRETRHASGPGSVFPKETLLPGARGISDEWSFKGEISGRMFEHRAGFSRLIIEAGANPEHGVQLTRCDAVQRLGGSIRSHLVMPPSGQEMNGGVRVDRLRLHDLPWLADARVAGVLNGRVDVSGLQSAPLVTCSLAGFGVKAWDVEVGHLSTELLLEPDRVVVKHITLGPGGSLLVGSGSVDHLKRAPKGGGTIRFGHWKFPWMAMQEGGVEWRVDGSRVTLTRGEVVTANGRYRVSGGVDLHMTPLVFQGNVDLTRKMWEGREFGAEGQLTMSADLPRQRMSLRVDVKPRVGGQDLPPLRLAAQYAPGTLTIANLRWGEWGHAGGTVRWGKTPTAVNLELALDRWDLRSLLGACGVEGGGMARGSIRVHGFLPWPNADGKITVDDLRVRGLEYARASVEVNRSQRDVYAFSVRAGQDADHGFGHRTDEPIGVARALSAKGTVALAGVGSSVPVIDAEWIAANQSIAQWLSVIMPVPEGETTGSSKGRGTATVRGQMVGPWNRPVVKADVTLQDGWTAWTGEFDMIRTSVSWRSPVLALEGGSWVNGEDRYQWGHGEMTWLAPRAGRPQWKLELADGRVEPLKFWNIRMSADLKIRAASVPGGTTFRVEGNDVVMNGFPYGPIRWSGRMEDATQRLVVKSDDGLTGLSFVMVKDGVIVEPGRLSVPGGASMPVISVVAHDGPPAQDVGPAGIIEASGSVKNGMMAVRVKGTQVNTPFALRVLKVKLEGEGRGTFECRAYGRVEGPRVKGSLAIEDGRFELWPFDLLTGEFVLDRDIFTMTSWNMSKAKRYEVTANGRIPLGSSREMSVEVGIADESLDLAMPLGWFNTLSGRLHGRIVLEGSAEQPTFRGICRMEQGVAKPKALFAEVTDLGGTFEFSGRRCAIRGVTGRVKETPIRLEGDIMMDRYRPERVAVKVTTDGKPVEFWLQGMMDARLPGTAVIQGYHDQWLRMEGPMGEPTVSGVAKVSGMRFTWPPRGGGDNEKDSALFDFLRRTTWDIRCDDGEQVVYANQVCEFLLEQGGALTFKGLGRRINLGGAANVERGKFKYLDHEFVVTSGQANWTGEGKTVYLKGQAEAQVQRYRITAQLSGKDQAMGPMDELVLKMSSEPSLTQQQIAALLTVGIDTSVVSDQVAAEQFQDRFTKALLKQGLTLGLRQTGIHDIVRHVMKVDEFDISPGAALASDGAATIGRDGLEGLLSGPKLSVGKYLTERFFLGYSVSRGVLQGVPDWRQELKMEYRLSGQSYLETRLYNDDLKVHLLRKFEF